MINCQFESGGNASLRHAVVDSIITRSEDNSILLTKRADWLSNGGKWSLSGGFIDRDETASDAALREVHEETGITGKIIELFAINDHPDRGDDRQNIVLIFVVQLEHQSDQYDRNEVTELRWVTADNIPPKSDWAFDHYEVAQSWFHRGKSIQPTILQSLKK